MLFTEIISEAAYDSHLQYLSNGEGVKLNLRSANLSYANLSYADLRSANLIYADLSSADLSYTDLSSTNLIYANLNSANLVYTDLSSANLIYADLSSANLNSADLRYAIGNNKEVRSYQFGTYLVVLYLNKMSIGCQTHTLEDWWGFTDAQIKRMDSKALEWWGSHKEILKSISELTV